jgi:hypothetical protein
MTSLDGPERIRRAMPDLSEKFAEAEFQVIADE